jgi:glucans biosynthesis protein
VVAGRAKRHPRLRGDDGKATPAFVQVPGAKGDMMIGGISRRALLGAGTALAAETAFGAPATGRPFSWEALQAEAMALAARPYRALPPPPAAAEAVGYDAREDIQFRADRALLGNNGAPAVRLFPTWKLAAQPVEVAVVENGRERPVPFSRDLFTGGAAIPQGGEGFSGFRVMTPSGRSDWLAYQGASYFRSAGGLDQYGLSARALAIDTGLSRPEEFPRFTRFWLETGPADGLTVYALLDSPSVAGAWRFRCTKGTKAVVQEVNCVFRLRRGVERLGVAPLTSMFWYGEGNRYQAVDWRPEIHDSDGLALLTGAGERIWRPLANPPVANTSSFSDRAPRGFGLLQRDRRFDHYQDDGVYYERRPSLWIEPKGDWGPGAVALVELPTPRETDDNIVAFWRPAAPAKAGERFAFSYTMRWMADEPAPVPPARVVDSWRGTAGPPGEAPTPGATRLVADFEGPSLAGLTQASGVEPRVSLSRGQPVHVVAYSVAGTGRWRLIVDVPSPHGQPLDARAYLSLKGNALSETLVYQFVSGDEHDAGRR